MCATVVVDSRIWIGLDDLAVEGEFRWGSGALLEWTHWRNNQPNGDEDQGCAAAIQGDDLKWVDDYCFPHLTHGLICQHVPGR